MRRSRLPEFLLALLIALPPAAAALERVAGPAPSPRTDLRWEALRRYSTQQGLPQNTVQALAQDRDGYVYAATEDGVAQFDGRAWRRVELPAQGDVRPFTTHLAATGDGALWIGTDSAGLWRRDASGALARIAQLPPELSLEALIPRDGASVYAGTPRGVYRCDAALCTPLAGTESLEVATLLAGVGPNGPALWIGTNIAGLYRLDGPDALRPALSNWRLGKADGLPNDAVRSLAQWGGKDSRDLWIGTGRGLARLAGDRLVVYDAAGGFPEGSIAAILASRDADGTPLLRVGLARAGVAELRDDGSVRLTTRAEGLPEDSVRSLLETGDAPGHRLLWIGTTSSGVVRREPSRWTALDERHGLPHRVVFGMGRAQFPDGLDTYWVGTIEGPARWVDGRWQRVLPPPHERAIVFSAVHDRDRLWLGTDRGLVALGRDGVASWSVDNSALPGLTVLDVEPEHDALGDRLWIGTRHGLARLEQGTVTVERLPPLGDDPLVRELLHAPALDATERLWAATSNGLGWRDGAAWHAVPDGCLPHPELMDVKRRTDAAGRTTLWAATRAGITRIAVGGTIACETMPASSRPPGQIYHLAFDGAGRLYAFGSAGVTRYTFAGDALVPVKQVQFGIEDGLPGLEFNRASYVDAAGRVWAGGVDGLALYDPASEAPPAPPSPLRLRVARTEHGTPLVPGASLAAGDDSVTIEAALLSFERPEQIRYRAELDGLRNQNAEWTADGRFVFSRLPPGDYRLRLSARDADGVEAAPIEMPFHVRAPWWQTRTAIAAWAALLVLAGVAFGRWRNRALKRRAQRLERDVAVRTRELADANRRLEHASLTDPLTGLWNRRHFALEMPGECARVTRRVEDGDTDIAIGLVLIDCDHFKQINDRHGHDIGDAVLVELAARLRDASRDGDMLLRWGGEEFLLVLRGDGRSGPAAATARILDVVGGTPFAVPGHAPLRVTCSIGACAFPFDAAAPSAQSLDACLRYADAALYRAKRGGRARGCLAQTPGNADDEPLWIEILPTFSQDA
jgi:diguanylate cyclase (GGDEF)-like protein